MKTLLRTSIVSRSNVSKRNKSELNQTVRFSHYVYVKYFSLINRCSNYATQLTPVECHLNGYGFVCFSSLIFVCSIHCHKKDSFVQYLSLPSCSHYVHMAAWVTPFEMIDWEFHLSPNKYCREFLFPSSVPPRHEINCYLTSTFNTKIFLLHSTLN